MKKEYLPIGSVVLLKGATKRIMINGFYAKNESNEVFDYMGVLYPEGVIEPPKSLLFNHDQIDKVFFIGYSDQEEQSFKARLYNMIEEEENK